MVAFGFCFLTATNCPTTFVHTLQSQQLRTGIIQYARPALPLQYSNLTIRQSGRTVLQDKGEVIARFLMHSHSLTLIRAKHGWAERTGVGTLLFTFEENNRWEKTLEIPRKVRITKTA
jgi:hypothetical protein